MRRKNPVPKTPMHELIRLIEKVDTVIKDYLRQRFTVTADAIKTLELESIISRLRVNPHYYTDLLASANAPKDPSTFRYVTDALVTSVKYIDKTVRHYFNTDGVYRLDTLEWMCWSLRNFQLKFSQYEQLSAETELMALSKSLTGDIKVFFDAINRILVHTASDEKSAFRLARGIKVYRIYGLKDDQSELGRLMKAHLLDEFDCQSVIEKVSSDIAYHAKSLYKAQRERAKDQIKYQASIKQLEETNTELLRQLELTHNSVQQLQAELHGSRDRAAMIESELRIKTFQEGTYERRIGKLEKEKNALEKKQSQADKGSISIAHLQSEIEEMRQALTEAELKHREVVNERKELLSQVQSEQQHQADIQKKLTDAHAANSDLAVQLDQPEASYDEEEWTYHQEGDDEVEDSYDVDLLSLRLHEHAEQVSNQKKISKQQFPEFDEEYDNGLTSAQVFVIQGQYKHLKALLKRDEGLVNRLCEGVGKSPLGKKSLLELALFHSRASFRDKKETLALILQYRPMILTGEQPVLLQITSRMQTDSCHSVLREMFCEYAVAQKTCSSEARQTMKTLMTEIDHLLDAIQANGQTELLRQLSLPLTVCRVLHYGYINGSFSKSTPFLDGKKLDDSAVNEVLYDNALRIEAENKYERKHGVPLMRKQLINMLSDLLQQYLANSSWQSVDVKRNDSTIMLDEGELGKIQNLQSSASIKSLPQPVDEMISANYTHLRDIVTAMLKVISRYGIILNSKCFNVYQRDEITRQIEDEEKEKVLMPDVMHEESMSLNI